MQTLKNIRPVFVDTDTDELAVDGAGNPLFTPERARYLKNYRIQFNRNANLESSTGDGKPAGANFGSGTKLQSNKAVVITRPEGYNKIVGAYEAKEINKLFYCNYNSKGLHGLYMIDGETMQASIVSIDPEWNFSLDPKHACSGFSVKLSYHADGRVREIHLTFTDGKNWQRWINVLSAIKTEGFDVVKYPYFAAVGPHRDRACLLDLATRPPMFCPKVAALPLVAGDENRPNKLLKASLQFAQQFIYTDGRSTTLSQWSNPYSVKQAQCSQTGAGLPRGVRLTLDGGCAQVERVRLLFRKCKGDWYLYDTIEKFKNCGDNSPEKVGDEYWKRTGPYADYNYDPQTNTFQYDFYGDQDYKPFSQEDAKMLWNGLPILSFAATAAGDALLLGNNKYDYDNLSCELLKGFRLKVSEQDTTACVPKQVSLKLYSFISRDAELCQVAYRLGETGDVLFGGMKRSIAGMVSIADGESGQFELSFGEKEGPLVYLAGTPYYSIGKQHKVNPDGTMEEIGVLDMSKQDVKDFVSATFRTGGYFVFVHEFPSVPATKYIARMARHNADAATGGWENTSSYVMGIANSKKKAPNQPNIFQDGIVTRAKELEVDACAGSVDVWGSGKDLFYIYAPYDYVEDGFAGIENRRWRFIEGYIREDRDTERGVPLLSYDTNHGFAEYKRSGLYTDHNGFYFAFTARGEAKEALVEFKGKLNCAATGPVLFRNRELPAKERGWYKDQNIYVADKNGGKFGDCNRVLVRGKIVSCDEQAPLGGIAVTITRGGTTYTDNNGEFELVVHNSYENVRQDRIYFNASGLCQFAGCDCSCVPLEFYSDAGVACVNCTERVYQTAVNRSFRVLSHSGKALKGGGRYGIGMVGWDLAGRGTYVNLLGYPDIPTFLEKGRFTPSVLSWFLPNAVKFPKEIAWVSFFRTANLIQKGATQWVGDSIEFLDHDGRVIEGDHISGAIRARVRIQSLLDFNVQNNFATTAKYQFVAGDVLRIYDDGKGNLFAPSATGGFMDYEIQGTNWEAAVAAAGNGTGDVDSEGSDGASFIIPFDRRLLALKERKGFWIELVRPKQFDEEEPFFEICGMYPVVDGELSVRNGVLDTWDTYYQPRVIKIDGVGGMTFAHPFESDAVSDYWGAGCDSGGRLHVRDEQAKQTWYPDDVIKSDEFVNEGRVNGLGMYRSKNRKPFKGQDMGGIVAMHAERNIIAFVCEHDWFLTDYQMNYARVNSDGLILANLAQNLGDPHQKVGSNFGCAPEHKGAILFEDGLAMWPCAAEGGWIVMDYGRAEDVAHEHNKSYFTEKFRFITRYNQELSAERYESDCIDIIAGYDPMYRDVLVTFRPRRGKLLDTDTFVNEEREVKIAHQETFRYSLDMKKWTGWTGFTPEWYGSLRNAGEGMLLVAFSAGQPWLHNSREVTTFNNFFGRDTESVITGIYNHDPKQVKVYQGIVQESNPALWSVDKLRTMERDSFSYIPPKHFVKRNGMWYAWVLRDMSSYPPLEQEQSYRQMLFDGKAMFGQWMLVRLIADGSGYVELNNIWIRSMLTEVKK